MELKIYNQTGDLKLTVSPNTSSTVTEEVMGECAVSVGFTYTEFVMLDVNDYIEIEGVRYMNMSQYRPKQKNTQTYEYSVKFYAPIHQAENTLMLFTPDDEMTSEFAYDGGPREHLQLWIDNMNRIAGSNVWKIGTVITAENKVIEYKNVKCWDAAFGSNGIAATFDTEMWADGYYINLCKAERGERVDLGYLQGLTSLQQEENGEVKFFTRLFPLGSTRNIDASKYGHSRLQLPGGVQFVDKNVNIYGVKEEFEEEAFSDIYPKYIGTVQSVRTENLTNTEGRDYTVYYIKDAAIPFNPNDYEIPEYTKMIAFQSGELAGRGDDDGSFQANWHEDTKEWEIINTYPDEDTQIPGGLIIPKVGDTYIPWNFRMPDSYIEVAEQAYLEAVNDYLNEYSFDTNKYSGQTDRNHIENNGIRLMMGLNVRLHSATYFSGGYKDTRISKVVRQLNDLCQATVTCTDKIGDGWKRTINNEIENLQYELAKQAERIIYDVIKSYESKTPSDKNIFSSLKAIKSFLRKDEPDETVYLLKLLGGIVSTYLQSPDFVPGAIGTGFTIKQNEDRSSYAEVDKLLVRKKAIFQLLEILKTELGGSSFLFNASGARATLTKVEKLESEAYFIDGDKAYFPNDDEVYFPDVYRCYFMVDDGDTAVENLFKVGDFVRSQTFNIQAGVHEGVSNHYWWSLVVGKGKDYIDISSVDMDEGSDEPAEGDVIVQLGNIDDIDRQAAIVMSAYGDGAPSLTMYQGINSYSLSGKDVFNVYYDKVAKECIVKIFGSGFWGARDETSFLRFNQKTKKFDIKANVEIIGGFNDAIAQSIGYSDYKSLIEEAAKGKTIMKGGYINLEVLDAKTIITSELIAAAIKAKALEIGDGKNINSKIDTDGSATFRNVKAIKGQFEDVVVNGSIRSGFEEPEDSFSSEYSDNIIVSGGGGYVAVYTIPSGVEHIGRKITICCKGSGYASFKCEKGDFYEYGKKTSELLLNKEVVQIIGYGIGEEFYGWIVTSRNDLDITYSIGRPDKILAKGIIDMRGDMQKYYAYDGKQLSIVTESKKITVTMPSEWGTIKDDYMVMITPLSRSSFSAGTYYVNVKSDTVFEILYMGEGTGQGGAAFFEIKRLNFI